MYATKLGRLYQGTYGKSSDDCRRRYTKSRQELGISYEWKQLTRQKVRKKKLSMKQGREYAKKWQGNMQRSRQKIIQKTSKALYAGVYKKQQQRITQEEYEKVPRN